MDRILGAPGSEDPRPRPPISYYAIRSITIIIIITTTTTTLVLYILLHYVNIGIILLLHYINILLLLLL